MALTLRARLALLVGGPDGADPLIALARAALAASPDRRIEGALSWLEGRVGLIRQQPRVAEQHYTALRAIADRDGDVAAFAAGTLGLARVALLHGRRAEAEKVAMQALSAARVTGDYLLELDALALQCLVLMEDERRRSEAFAIVRARRAVAKAAADRVALLEVERDDLKLSARFLPADEYQRRLTGLRQSADALGLSSDFAGAR